jgi:hypothetical protein
MAFIKLANTQVRKLQPSTRFASQYADMAKAADHFDSSMNLLAKGIDDVDPKKIQQSNTELNLGTATTLQGIEKLKKLIGQ